MNKKIGNVQIMRFRLSLGLLAQLNVVFLLHASCASEYTIGKSYVYQKYTSLN